MFVIIETRGLLTFVASSLPPSPTSITAMSTFSSAKYKNAMAVVNSKKVGARGTGQGACFFRPLTLDPFFYPFHQLCHFLIRYFSMIYSYPLIKSHKMRRCIKPCLVSCLNKDRSNHCRGRTFTICSSYMDYWKFILR